MSFIAQGTTHWSMVMHLSGEPLLVYFVAVLSFLSLLSTLSSKHIFIPNFANVECGYTEITPETKPLIESGYEARTEKELAVLVEYIDRKRMAPPQATWLDIILYSREQIIKENEAMGNEVRDILCRPSISDSLYLSCIATKDQCPMGYHLSEGTIDQPRASHATNYYDAQCSG